MKIRTFLNIKINIPNIDDFYPSKKKSNEIYETELLYENDEFILKVFFKLDETLDHKIMNWVNRSDDNFLEKIEVVKICSPEHLLDIQFKDYRIKKIQSSSSFNDEYLFFLITIDGIKKIFKNSEKQANQFYLNQQGFKLVEYNFEYNYNSRNNPYKWEPKNKMKHPIVFNDLSFNLDYNIYNSKNSEQTIEIKKEPIIKVKYNNQTEKEIKKQVKLICSLYSFYSQKTIDYTYSRIYTKDKLYIEFRKVENTYAKNIHGMFRWDFKQNPTNLFLKINQTKILNNDEFLIQIIERYNYAFKTVGETKFMVFYSILEQLRNKYVADNEISKDIKETYSFQIENPKELIKEKLLLISEKISENDRVLFDENINNLARNMLLKTMKNQFHNLFEVLSLFPNYYNVEFANALKLRNRIFHGRELSENNKRDLLKLNKYDNFPKFVGLLILKYMGITLNETENKTCT